MKKGAEPAPILRAQRVILRPPRESDEQDRLACGRHPEYVRMVGGDYRSLRPLTLAEVKRSYRRLQADQFGWSVEYTGRCIGSARLHGLVQADQRASYAIGIWDSKVWGQGLGTEVTRLVLRYAFERLRLHRVSLRVLAYNHRAIRCYEKCGFVREGVERESALVAGEWHDDFIMGILQQEYREQSASGGPLDES